MGRSRHLKRLSLAGALRVSGLALTAACAAHPAAADDWANPGAGSWFVDSNWADGTAPTASDNAFIDNGGTAQVPAPSALADSIFVGASNGNSGALEITTGGTLDNFFSGFIGDQAGSTGTVTVDGAGSTWTAGGDLEVGFEGTGTLTIQNGGAVSSDFGFIGDFFGSTGTVTVDGAGSTWTASGDLNVGGSGTGTLTIQNGGRVNAPALAACLGAGSTGTLNIGAGGAAGVLNTASVDSGAGAATLNFNHSGTDYFFTNDGTAGGTAVPIAGSMAVNHIGPGTTVLTGANTYTGPTTIDDGLLVVSGSIAGSATTVGAGGTLGGTGTVSAVSVADSGTISPGFSAGTLTTGNLTLNNASVLDFELAAPGTVGGGVNDLIQVNGNLALDGVINVAGLAGFGAGSYRLFNYTGTLTDNTLNVGSLPGGFAASIDPGVAGEVNLVVTAATPPPPPANNPPTGAVTIDGPVREGETVTAEDTLADADGLGEFSYQWFLDDRPVLDATSASFALDDLAVGKLLRVEIAFTDGQGHAEKVSSTALGPVAPAGTDLPFQKRLFFVNPASNATQQTFIRLVNPNPGEVAVELQGFDDAGAPAPGGAVTFTLAPRAALQLTTQDLEAGSPAKGLDGALGAGTGKWQLKVNSSAPIEALSLIRTPDGFLTSVTETAPRQPDGKLELVFANPGGNAIQQSFIRVVNRTSQAGTVTVDAIDDAGMPAPGGELRFTLGPNAALNFNAEDYTAGNPAKGLLGAFGEGTGKWRLSVRSALNVEALGLIRSPDGFVTDLSRPAPRATADADADLRLLTINPAGNTTQQSFIRLLNPGDRVQRVILSGIDDGGTRPPGGVYVDLLPFAAVQLLAADLEQGNADKGVVGTFGGFGAGQGRWRVTVTPEQSQNGGAGVEAQSLLRVPGGFLTNLSSAAPQPSAFEAVLWIFNPGSNSEQRSVLRLMNLDDAPGMALIEAIDDAGQAAPGGSVVLDLAPNSAVELTAQELELGAADKGLEGALGDGAGKWRLHLSADVRIQAQSLLETPTGFLTDLSTTAQ